MQTFTYYVQTKSNLDHACNDYYLYKQCSDDFMLSPKPSVMDLCLLIIPSGIQIADLYSTKEMFC